ncbi:G_PROTEIN_RECEP_F1_2 domain-containing protein [Meloidogyne graminicola]|uniref:G_PROTEIN_RECEP_F1_2 domain-containing protein n=1 Tax=Meloidogyne graminicola TaxID=189291 RepID=A0A8T0A3F9_9BILA|nr:G_PROTEIN_RECEP_F1_2 domain-containing protein [Meloidogyne graminicola]
MHLFRINQTIINLNCQQQKQLILFNNFDLRFLIVGMIGTLISFISIIQNLLLFYVFATSKKLRRQNYVNPVLLALFDIFVSLIYLLISPIYFISLHFDFKTLINIWTTNIKILFCLQHFALTVCNFLLVIASIERYLANSPFYAQKCLLVFIVKRKPFVILLILLFAFLLKATLYFEINLIKLFGCSNESFIFILNFNNNKLIKYQSLRFWTRNIFSVILPFIILAYCNLCIVKELRRRRRKKTIGRGAYAPLILDLKNKKNKKLEIERRYPSSDNEHSERNINSPLPLDNGKIGVRIATRTLVMVVGCYLISNSISTLLNIWEYFDLKLLRKDNFFVYLITTDIAALLTICGCSLRLPIYISNDKRIRKAICRAFIRFRFNFCKKSKPTTVDEIMGHEEVEKFLEKYSIAIVSNSLRSNLTGNIINNGDFENIKGNCGINQLALLLQNRRRFLVQMTINLGGQNQNFNLSAVREIETTEEENEIKKE